MEFKTIELKESIFANNDREADRLRAELKGDKTFLLNRQRQDHHPAADGGAAAGGNAHRCDGGGH